MNNLFEYSGKLDTYTEQGYEGCFVSIFYDNRYTGFEATLWLQDLVKKKLVIEEATIWDTKDKIQYQGKLTLVYTKMLRNKIPINHEFYNRCKLIDVYFKELGWEKSCEYMHRSFPMKFKMNYDYFGSRGQKEEIKGYNIPVDTTERKAKVLSSCLNCGFSWKEEVTFTCGLANSKTYQYCSKCIPKDIKEKLE